MTPSRAHNRATASTSSGARGAKHDAVVTMQRTRRPPWYAKRSSSAPISVSSSSPYSSSKAGAAGTAAASFFRATFSFLVKMSRGAEPRVLDRVGSTTSGVRPASAMALKHDFWSMRSQSTTRLSASASASSSAAVSTHFWRMASRHRASERPVAHGSTRAAFISLRPASRSASSARQLHSLARSDDPAAFGCTAAMSPERPTPWARPK
mmetsp:Transcript_12441/g.41465  ORF Transcript_12441/g.41465 Transcript_12441/m.41465 type:complete len:209 (-) Transcript_12441:313-939(-)